MILGHCQKLIITLNVIKSLITTLSSLSSPFFNSCINIKHMVSTASLLQMIVIGVIMWLSFYENCYY